jgi:coproporphyrinogen III oxidase-like Fe-S oxidoreductase
VSGLAHWDVMSTQPPFGIYVHVPFRAARCGYCDFNTYTPSELAGSGALLTRRGRLLADRVIHTLLAGAPV